MANFNIYENMDKINADALMKSVYGTSDLGKVKLPKEQKLTLTAGGKTFTVKTKVATRLKNKLKEEESFLFGSQYDLAEALGKMKSAGEVIDELDPQRVSDGYMFAEPEFNFNGMTKLSEEQKKQRFMFLVAVAGKVLDKEVLTAIAEFAPKKKNGCFTKGKVTRIANLGIAEHFNSMVSIFGKATGETALEVIFDERSANPNEAGFMAEDFVNTLIDELGISAFVDGLTPDTSKTLEGYLASSAFEIAE